jgi:hypothetical protein
MSDDNQIEIPASFIALQMRPGRERPDAPFAVILERYERCEDMAVTLAEQAQRLLVMEGHAESDILARCHAGLADPAAGFRAPEARWVVMRLAELMGWEAPAFEA